MNSLHFPMKFRLKESIDSIEQRVSGREEKGRQRFTHWASSGPEEAQWAKRCLPFSSLPLTLCSILHFPTSFGFRVRSDTNPIFYALVSGWFNPGENHNIFGSPVYVAGLAFRQFTENPVGRASMMSTSTHDVHAHKHARTHACTRTHTHTTHTHTGRLNELKLRDHLKGSPSFFKRNAFQIDFTHQPTSSIGKSHRTFIWN